MSMTRSVLFPSPSPSVASVQKALSKLGFELTISDPSAPFDSYDGFMPVEYGADRRLTGVEVSIFEITERDIRDFIPKSQIGQVNFGFGRQLSLRWGGDLHELFVALAFSAAFAQVAGGVIFDDEVGALATIEDTIEQAKELPRLLGR